MAHIVRIPQQIARIPPHFNKEKYTHKFLYITFNAIRKDKLSGRERQRERETHSYLFIDEEKETKIARSKIT